MTVQAGRGDQGFWVDVNLIYIMLKKQHSVEAAL